MEPVNVTINLNGGMLRKLKKMDVSHATKLLKDLKKMIKDGVNALKAKLILGMTKKKNTFVKKPKVIKLQPI